MRSMLARTPAVFTANGLMPHTAAFSGAASDSNGPRPALASPEVQQRVFEAAKTAADVAKTAAAVADRLVEALGGSQSPHAAGASVAADVAAHAADTAAHSVDVIAQKTQELASVTAPVTPMAENASPPAVHTRARVGNALKEREFVDKVDPVAPSQVTASNTSAVKSGSSASPMEADAGYTSSS